MFFVEEEEAPLPLEGEGSGMSGSVLSFSSEGLKEVGADEAGGVVVFDTGASEAGRAGTGSAVTVS